MTYLYHVRFSYLSRPILTYGGRGTTKPGVKPSHHAIIYSTDCPPSKLSGELELGNTPIRIKVASPRHSFDPASRINYAKVYTVEHNVRVCFVGRVHGDSHSTLKEDYLKFQEICFSDNTDDSDGHDVDPTDRDDEAFSGDDGTLADSGEARNEPTSMVRRQGYGIFPREIGRSNYFG